MSDVESAKREEREARVQRISFQGMAATTSTLAALVVALTSAFTAIRAFALSESAAQQRVFERQLDACLELNGTVSQIASNNAQIISLMPMSPEGEVIANPSAASDTVTTRPAADEMEARLNTASNQLQLLDRETLRLNMLLPSDEPSAQISAAYDKQSEAYNMIAEARIANEGVTPEPVIQRSTTLLNGAVEDLDAATGLCQQHVSETVRRGTLG